MVKNVLYLVVIADKICSGALSVSFVVQYDFKTIKPCLHHVFNYETSL